MIDERLVGRREFLQGGLAFSTIGMLSGCIPLLGVILRGGALRAFSVSAARGGATSLAFLGRGVGIAGQSVRATRGSIPRTSQSVRIVNKEREVLAESVQKDHASILMQGNRNIFRSVPNRTSAKDIGRLDHVDANGDNVGRSVFEHDGRVDHFGRTRRGSHIKIGFDVVRMTRTGLRIVKHFDENGNETGETELDQDGGYTDIISDRSTDKYLTQLAEIDARCPELVVQRDKYNRVAQQCFQGVESACHAQSKELRRLRVLTQQCSDL